MEARLIVDWTDHIWTEYYSTSQERWIHLDPCEAIADKPLLYEAGWGKQLSYCIAIGRAGVHDVTRRYSANWSEIKRRRHLPEGWVRQYLAETTKRLRRKMTEEERAMVRSRDSRDEASMLALHSGTSNDVRKQGKKDEFLPGRTTGSAAWISSRGEGGRLERSEPETSSSKIQHDRVDENDNHNAEYVEIKDLIKAPIGRTNSVAVPTRYRRIACDPIAACRASGENPPDETADKAFENDNESKWLDFSGCSLNRSWIEYRLVPPNDAPRRLRSIGLTSANDAPERDPRHVAVDAWLDSPIEKWVLLKEFKDIDFLSRGSKVVLNLDGRDMGVDPSTLQSSRWRLRIVSVRDPQRANSVQLSSWSLVFEEPSDERERSVEITESTDIPVDTDSKDNPWQALFDKPR